MIMHIIISKGGKGNPLIKPASGSDNRLTAMNFMKIKALANRYTIMAVVWAASRSEARKFLRVNFLAMAPKAATASVGVNHPP